MLNLAREKTFYESVILHDSKKSQDQDLVTPAKLLLDLIREPERAR